MDPRSGPGAQQLSPDAKAGFEEGVGLIFSQWTALVLAVENEWGGPDSERKADYLIEDIIEWFYKKREHHVDELHMELADALLEEFQTEAEDGSPAQVAGSLLELYAACLRGDASVLQHLRQRPAAGAAASKQQRVDLDGAHMDGASSSGSGSGSSDDDGSDDDGMDEDRPPAAVQLEQQQQQQQQRPEPVVDADGFELVQKRKGRRQ